MDTLRRPIDTYSSDDGYDGYDSGHEHSYRNETVREMPPEAIGQDERRMQVRAYNYWASLLHDNSFPLIEDLDLANLSDFGSNSVLLDFSKGIEDPDVNFLGERLAGECFGPDSGESEPITKLSGVPPRSLLSRITDHYMQIIASEAPIGFEAEFVNTQGCAVLYRGILLPFSGDGETIDFIFGVINWKEIADAATADELLLEIDQAIDPDASADDRRQSTDPVTEWADTPDQDAEQAYAFPGPVSSVADGDVPGGLQSDEVAEDDTSSQKIDPLLVNARRGQARDNGLSLPDFSRYTLDDADLEEYDEDLDEDGGGADDAAYSFASLADYIEAPSKKAVDLDADNFNPEDYRVEETPSDAGTGESDDEILSPFDLQEEDLSQDDEMPRGDQSIESAPFEPAAAEPEQAPFSPVDSAPSFPQEAQTSDTGTPDEEPAQGEPATMATPVGPASPVPATAALPDDGDLREQADLREQLASARELARSARVTEDRSRQTLYAAVGRAYDFSLAAAEDPTEFNSLIEESGLKVQERAPMTPIVKLVFGADYDKTRLTEYAAVLGHAHRVGIERGTLPTYLREAEGGLKGVVATERRQRREEAGQSTDDAGEVREALAEKLRELEQMLLEAVSGEGPEFSLAVLRRDGTGNVSVIGEITDDVPLLERAAKKLVG